MAGRSLGWYDYGARFYEPEIGRFQTQDIMTEKNHFRSPYTYAKNNPVLFIDWFGLDPRYNWKTNKYYDDADGDGKQNKDEKNMEWEQVNKWITKSNGGIEIWNSEKGFRDDVGDKIHSEDFSYAKGIDRNIEFIELGFGKKSNRQYIRTYQVKIKTLISALGHSSPLSKEEKQVLFSMVYAQQHDKAAREILPWVIGSPVAVISGFDLVFSAAAGISYLPYATNSEMNVMAAKTLVNSGSYMILAYEFFSKEKTDPVFSAVIKAAAATPGDALSAGNDFSNLFQNK